MDKYRENELLRKAEEKKFLEKIGHKINKAAEVKKGDVLGEVSHNGIRLYTAKEVILELQPKMLSAPVIYLKSPHIGLSLTNGEVSSWYIHTPMPGSDNNRFGWYENLNEEDGEFIEYKLYDLYLITDINYVCLGYLINKVEIPLLGFMCQTRKNAATIHNFVTSIQYDLIKLNEAYDSIKRKCREWEV